MSFCSSVKGELLNLRVSGCCLTAYSYGYMLFARAFSIKRIALQTASEDVAKGYCSAIEKRYKIRPEIKVRVMLMITRAIAPSVGSCAILGSEVRCSITALMGIIISNVERIPSAPETNPTMSVSALNTLEISFFDAPIARRIPISFVLSRTEI